MWQKLSRFTALLFLAKLQNIKFWETLLFKWKVRRRDGVHKRNKTNKQKNEKTDNLSCNLVSTRQWKNWLRNIKEERKTERERGLPIQYTISPDECRINGLALLKDPRGGHSRDAHFTLNTVGQVRLFLPSRWFNLVWARVKGHFTLPLAVDRLCCWLAWGYVSCHMHLTNRKRVKK